MKTYIYILEPPSYILVSVFLGIVTSNFQPSSVILTFKNLLEQYTDSSNVRLLKCLESKYKNHGGSMYVD
jgi:hypothetical protein